MWRDALRVCQRHLPHLAHKVHAQYQVCVRWKRGKGRGRVGRRIVSPPQSVVGTRSVVFVFFWPSDSCSRGSCV